MARLQSVVDALGSAVRAVSPVYETDPWGGVEQDRFLNAIVVADDPEMDGHGWLRRAQAIERDNARVRQQRWGPRTLDVDLVQLVDVDQLSGGFEVSGGAEVVVQDPVLTLPHPLAHLRAFVLIPWLAVEPAAGLRVEGSRRPVRELLADVDPADRAGVRPTGLVLRSA